jgi:hypothetical protein
MGEDKDASPYPLQIPTFLLNGRVRVATTPRHVRAGFAPLERLGVHLEVEHSRLRGVQEWGRNDVVVIATCRSSTCLYVERVNRCSHVPPLLSIAHDRQGNPQVVWCPCMAQAPGMVLASKTHQGGHSGDVHPSMRHTCIALAMQGGTPLARTTLLANTGLVGYGQGTRNPADVAVSVLQKGMAAHYAQPSQHPWDAFPGRVAGCGRSGPFRRGQNSTGGGGWGDENFCNDCGDCSGEELK